MNKTKKIILFSIIGVIAAGMIAFVSVKLVRASNSAELINEQNYIAAKLIELGDYFNGRNLALKSELAKPNPASKQLVTLSYEFETDFVTAEESSRLWLENERDPLLEDIHKLSEEKLEEVSGFSGASASYRLDDETRSRLIELLCEVRDSIKLRRSIVQLQAMLDVYTGKGGSALEETVKRDRSLLGRFVKIESSLDKNDSEKAFEYADKLLTENPTFENRALLANIVCADYKLTASATELEKSDPETLKTEAAKRAINFIETTTPHSQKKTDSYDLERAYLYHMAGNENKAQQLLVGLISGEKERDALSVPLGAVTRLYRDLPAGSKRDYSIKAQWPLVSELLHLINDGSRQDGSFYTFFVDFLDQYYNAIIVSGIDTTDFPTVRVRLNIAVELAKRLKRSDFELIDMNSGVKGLKLIAQKKTELDENTSIMMVVDRSGSMEGKPIADTIAAVNTFVKSLDAKTKAGLVAFDSASELLAAPDTRRLQLTASLNALKSGGGTNICSGLEAALNAFRSDAGRKIIVLLTDGADGAADLIDEVLSRLVAENITVYTIGFGMADADYLSYIAGYCGGKYLYADSSELLAAIYGEIGSTLENDYLLEFTATEDIERFARKLSIMIEKLYAATDSDYHVGVKAESIEREEKKSPTYDCFRQYGGSFVK